MAINYSEDIGALYMHNNRHPEWVGSGDHLFRLSDILGVSAEDHIGRVYLANSTVATIPVSDARELIQQIWEL